MFPGIDNMIESQVQPCLRCHTNGEPITSLSDLLEVPWTHITVDSADVLGSYLLVLYDEYSRFLAIDIIPSLSAKTVIPRTDKILLEFEIASILKTVNGSPFQRKDFELFQCYLGYKHHKITPYWPRANGGEESHLINSLKNEHGVHLINFFIQHPL